MQAVGRRSSVDHYIIESKSSAITVGGVEYRGVPVEGYPPPLFLFVIPWAGDVSTWPASIHGHGPDSPRRSPTRTEDWWLVTQNRARAVWPGLGFRSTGRPLEAQQRADINKAVARLRGGEA